MSDPHYSSLTRHITDIQKKMPLAASNLSLVAVSKQQPDDRVHAILQAGHRVFGENRVQEAQARWGELRHTYPDLELHLIGGLQSNKVRTAVALFDVIETIDTLKLADQINAEAARIEKVMPCLVQVNIGDEPQKSGVLPGEALIELVEYCHRLPYIALQGLMCIPPSGKAPSPYFACMRQWQKRFGLPDLSMGMSGDYEQAIRFGATHIRLGTAVFGERK